jgi:molybdopterin molybdotransferase
MTQPRRLLDDCFLHDRERLRHDEAIALIQERLTPVVGIEAVRLEDAHGRILAEDVTAPRDVPAYTNAAVDGYAFGHSSLDSGSTRLAVVDRAAAGERVDKHAGPGEAVRIFTGAELPRGCDTCIMQEDVEADGTSITIAGTIRKGANTRKAGEDVRAGERVAAAGTRLRPQDIAAIASTGAEAVACFERLRIAILSSGDEVVRPGQDLAPGQVYDSNHHMLRGLLGTVAADIEDLGVLKDDATRIREVVEAADADVIISTGGVSRGEADHILPTILERGTLHAWQLAVKPGRPMALGQIGDKVLLGLPGNPVAVFVTFLLYGQPILARLQGAAWRPPQRYRVASGFAFEDKKPGRREFWRGWIEEEDGVPTLRKFTRDGSGLISGLRQARGLIEVPEDVTSVRKGDMLAFIPFTEFGLAAP